MKVKNIIKKQTTIVALAVCLVVLAAIGVSYAIFFDVKANSSNQVITAGTLKLTMTNVAALSLSEPVSTSSGLASTPFSYTVQNTDSNLPATYTIYIYANSANTVALNSVNLSLDGSTATKLTSLTSSTCTDDSGTYTCYKLSSGSVAAGASETTKNIYVWIDESSLTEEISDASLSLYLQIVSEVNEQ